MRLRLLGDCHYDAKKINQWKQDYENYDLNIQLGDYGVGFGAEKTLDWFNPDKFKILSGNHDNYSLLAKYPHNLGRYGILDIGFKIFFVCGAYSIDQNYRTAGLSWWSDEELNYLEADDCLDLWEKNCVDIDMVISHDMPINIAMQILGFFPNETITGRLLYEMWKIKEPKEWYSGHHHRNWNKKISNTNFRCLNINEAVVLDIL